MKKVINILCVILSALLLSTTILVGCTKTETSDQTEKETVAEDGNSEKIKWTLENGTLTVSGNGDMPDYDYGDNRAPWSEHAGDVTAVVIEDGITSIGAKSFAWCTGITSVTVKGSVVGIGDNAFYGCSGLTTITIPDGVTVIGNSAFASCDALASITIPNGVTSIGVKAFESCDALASITIPDSVTSLGDFVFAWCVSLTDIHFGGTVEQWNALISDNTNIPQNATVHCSDGDI
jgi:hypothetical protein